MSRGKIRFAIGAILLGCGCAVLSMAMPAQALGFGPEAGACGPGGPGPGGPGAFGPPGHFGPDGFGGPGGPGGFEKILGLSDAQSEKLRALKDDSRDFQAMKMIEKGKLHRKMMDLLDAQTIDKKAIGSLQQQIGDLESAMGVERTRTAAEIAEVLTPEQRKILRKKRLEGPPMPPMPPMPFMPPMPPMPPHKMPPPPANGQGESKRVEPTASESKLDVRKAYKTVVGQLDGALLEGPTGPMG